MRHQTQFKYKIWAGEDFFFLKSSSAVGLFCFLNTTFDSVVHMRFQLRAPSQHPKPGPHSPLSTIDQVWGNVKQAS